MFIPSEVKEHLLIPMLSGKLNVPIFNFLLHADDGDHAYPAFLTRESLDGKFKLTLHDPTGEDIDRHFTKKRELTPDDAIIGTGVLNGRFKVKFPSIYPPTSRPAFYSAEVSHSRAITGFQTVEIPASGSENSTYQETRERLAKLNNQPPPIAEPSENFGYEHLAIFPRAELYYVNAAINSKVEDPFWGGWTENAGRLLNGTIWDGEFSIRQWSDHLMLGFKVESATLDDSNSRWWALREAVAFTLAFQPWPAYELTCEDGRIVNHELHAKSHWQDSMCPLGKAHFKPKQEVPVSLIRSIGEWLASLPEDQHQTVCEALWIFRSADSPNTPFPAQQAMICGVVESLFTLFKPDYNNEKEPESFLEIKQSLKSWSRELSKQFSSPDHKPHVDSLRQFLGNWKFGYRTRRQEWMDTFGPLFPGKTDWLEQQRTNFNDLRHPVAHGNFSMKEDQPIEPLFKLGELAAFVNAIIAAKAGFKGPVKVNVWSDEFMTI